MKPRYRLRVRHWHTGAVLWKVQHVAGCQRDHLIYSTDWWPSAARAVREAALIPVLR